MAKYVCSGAKLKCAMGSQQSDLGVIPTGRCPVFIKGKLMATMMDHKPFINIRPFGQCKSIANPVVAAATAANYGRLQSMPCVPNTATPWIGAKMNVLISGEPTLLDNSKLMCMWLGMIEITNAGHNLVQEGAASADAKSHTAASEKKAYETDAKTGSPAETGEPEETAAPEEDTPPESPEETDDKEEEELKKLTVKDFVEILTKIESAQSYEAARHYAMNEIDYWKINLLAQRYVNAPDAKTKSEEKDNDPNQMPTRFMLLYGADDGKLECIDDHPDSDEPMKINVKMLREGLRLLGYDYVKEDGPFDDYVYHAFLNYHWLHGRVKIGGTYEYEDDHEKPLDRIANKYGVSTWKYIEKEHDRKADHDIITEELSAEYGDELLAEKDVDPQMFKPGVAYHYVWVPHRVEVAVDEDIETENIKVQIFSHDTMKCVGEGECS